MPEFPEVQTLIRHLKNQDILQTTIIDSQVDYPNLLKNCYPDEWKKFIYHRKIIDILQFGKHLIFQLDNCSYFVSHLRMEGKFFVWDHHHPLELRWNKHTLLTIVLANKKTISYIDTRRFGTIHIFDSKNKMQTFFDHMDLGPQPFDQQLTVDYLFNKLQTKKIPIKTFLLDQKNISGLGNIYADEVLFQSKIHPLTKTNVIDRQQVAKIIQAIHMILTTAIKQHGTTVFSYRFGQNHSGSFQRFLHVYHRQNLKCHDCHDTIQVIKINGRSSHFCPSCQKYKNS